MNGLSPRSPTYELLKHVEFAPRVDTENFPDPENTLEALSLFYLPNIEHLRVCIDNPIEFSWPCLTPPNPLMLTSLELDRIREVRLEQLLSALKNLRKLKYNWFFQADMDPKWDDELIFAAVRSELESGGFSEKEHLKQITLPGSNYIDEDEEVNYFWTRKLDGRVKVWYNDYPNKPTWREAGEIADGVGTSGANVRYGTLSSTGRVDYIPLDRKTGAIAAWLNGCNDFDASEKKHKITIFQRNVHGNKRMWGITEYPLEGRQPKDHCDLTGKYSRSSQISPNDPDDAEYPTLVTNNDKIYGKECYYIGSPYSPLGKLIIRENALLELDESRNLAMPKTGAGQRQYR
ncbi:hypothetical protein Neosp_000036 [[Neocosmospora] mangrovei]